MICRSLHLNGYKIGDPTVVARIDSGELDQFLGSSGWTQHYVQGEDPEDMLELTAVADETTEVTYPI